MDLPGLQPGGNGSGERPDWNYIYSELIMVTGWTWEYIDDQMTLPRLYGLYEYWRDHPPLHALVAAFLGVKPSPKPESKQENTLDQMIGDFAIAGMRMN